MALTQNERDWLDWLKQVKRKQIKQREAAERMVVSERWVRRPAVKAHEERRRPGGGAQGEEPGTSETEAIRIGGFEHTSCDVGNARWGGYDFRHLACRRVYLHQRGVECRAEHDAPIPARGTPVLPECQAHSPAG